MQTTISRVCFRNHLLDRVMRNGIVREKNGFDLLVDGAIRAFSPTEDGAFEMARELKRKNSKSRVQIRVRATGATREMLEDGRIR